VGEKLERYESLLKEQLGAMNKSMKIYRTRLSKKERRIAHQIIYTSRKLYQRMMNMNSSLKFSFKFILALFFYYNVQRYYRVDIRYENG